MSKHALELDQAALRAVIDAVAMIRAQSARLSFAALVAAVEGEAAALPEVEAARVAVAEGLLLVAGDAPVEDHAPVNVGWLREVAAGEAGLIERFRAFDALAGDLLDAARDGRVTTALAQRVVTAGADDFYAATTLLMVLLWTDLETRRGESVAAARTAIEAAGEAFHGLVERASLARLLALNARIEAAHAKEAAFAVIATEIGAMADDIGGLAAGVGRTLDAARARL